MKNTNSIMLVLLSVLAVSCGSGRLVTSSVAYQSIRTSTPQPTKESPIPSDAKIAVAYALSPTGELTVVVYNRTSEIMTIDQTKSFFVNSSGESISYYDPTIRTESVTDITSSTKGVSVNLGAVSNALGIGGVAGKLAQGINVGGAGTSGTSTTQTVTFADQPRISIGPYGSGSMSKVFTEPRVGSMFLTSAGQQSCVALSEQDSYCKFSVSISYSLDGERTFDTITTNFYANSCVVAPVQSKGRVNDALRSVLSSKTDALNEYWYMLYFNSQLGSYMHQGLLFDYK